MNRFSRTGSLVPAPDWTTAGQPQESGPTLVFMIVVTLLGAVLRLYCLAGQSLWVDELLTWQMLHPGIAAGFREQVLDTIQGPLYLAVVWSLVRLQDTAFMMRIPAAVAGIATIPLFGLMVDRLLPGRAARLAVLLLALNPFHVWYSQESRGYSFLMLFSVLMALAFLELIRRKEGFRTAAFFSLATAGAVWSNLGGLFLWMGMALCVLIFHFPAHRREWRLWGLAFGGGLLLVSPWLLKAAGIWAVDRVLPGGGVGEALRGETTFSPLAWPYTLQTFFYGYSLGPSLRELHQPDRLAVLRGAWPILLLGALPVGVGLLSGVVRLNRKRGLLLVWILVPMIVLTILALRNVKPWNPRYLAMTLPWVLAMAAWGLATLPRRVGLAATLLLTCLTLWSLGGYYWDARYAKADVRAAAMELEKANPQGDAILVPVVTSVFNYYYHGPGEVLDTYGLGELGSIHEAREFLEGVLADKTSCWLVLAREWYFDPHGYLPVAMSRSGHLRLVAKAPGVKVYAWEKQSASGGSP